jgi:hypothetical protein
MVTQKSPNLDERLKAIREAVDGTVVVTVGLKKTGEMDILDVKNLFEDSKKGSKKDSEKPSYLG